MADLVGIRHSSFAIFLLNRELDLYTTVLFSSLGCFVVANGIVNTAIGDGHSGGIHALPFQIVRYCLSTSLAKIFSCPRRLIRRIIGITDDVCPQTGIIFHLNRDIVQNSFGTIINPRRSVPEESAVLLGDTYALRNVGGG